MRRHVKAVAIAIFGVLLVGCGLQQPVGGDYAHTASPHDECIGYLKGTSEPVRKRHARTDRSEH